MAEAGWLFAATAGMFGAVGSYCIGKKNWWLGIWNLWCGLCMSVAYLWLTRS